MRASSDAFADPGCVSDGDGLCRRHGESRKKGSTFVKAKVEPGTKTVPDGQKRLDELTCAVKKQMEKVGAIGRKMAVEIYRAGEILSQIRDMLKTAGGWKEYQLQQGWNRGTVARYIKLY